MSRDISILDLPADAKSIAEIPDDFRPSPLGPRSELIARIQRFLPEVDVNHPTWGTLNGPGFSIEFNMNMASHDICKSFMLHLRGSGDVVRVLSGLLGHLGLRGLDYGAGDFFSAETAGESFAEWQAYRDRVVGGWERRSALNTSGAVRDKERRLQSPIWIPLLIRS